MMDETLIYDIIDYDLHMCTNAEFVGMRWSEDMKRSMTDYLFRGFEPGGHLSAMLAGDLQRAMWNADIHSRTVIWATARWIHTYVPEQAKGSYEAVSHWRDHPELRQELYDKFSKEKMWAALREE